MKGWKYNARIKVRPMQLRRGGGRIVVQKWREGGVSANTFYFTMLNEAVFTLFYMYYYSQNVVGHRKWVAVNFA